MEWQTYLKMEEDDKYQSHSPEHYYLAQIALAISTAFGSAKNVSLTDFLIKFVKPKKLTPKEKEEALKQYSEASRAKWGFIAKMRSTGVRIKSKFNPKRKKPSKNEKSN